MANLKFSEKARLERLFKMDGGYVLDFSNRTLQEFVLDSVGRDIYEGKYDQGSGSKANRLRCFWKIESGFVVGKLIIDLIDYLRIEGRIAQPSLANECLDVALRLQKEGTPSEDGGPDCATSGTEVEVDASATPIGQPSARVATEGGAAANSFIWKLANELARVVHRSDDARGMVIRAGFPPQFLPEFRSPLVFWTEIVKQADNGRIRLGALVEEVSSQYPYNLVLREYSETLCGLDE